MKINELLPERLEPFGLWSFYHMTVDFNEERNRNTYWEFRNDPNFASLSDDEIKDKVAEIIELANVIAQITFNEISKEQSFL